MPFNILGIVFSLVGLAQIKKSPETFTGRGMAIAGLALSIFSVVLIGVMIAVFGVYFLAEMKKGKLH